MDSPRVFDMLQYLKRFYVQIKAFDPLYKMSYILWVVALLGNLWRLQQWLPSWAPSSIFPRIRNQVKTAKNGNFFVLEVKNITKINTLHDFSHKIYFYFYSCAFTQKWLERLLLMTSYLVTIETDYHLTWIKIHARDERTAVENIRCWCFIH